MTIQPMCEVGQVSRATFYRFGPDREPVDEDLDLRDEIQRVALEFPCCGWPRITAELKRLGWDAGHRRVGRIMRQDNLLCLRKRQFVVTTDSTHNLRVYRNLAGGMTLTGIDQLWIADITYIRLEKGVRIPGGGARCSFTPGHRMGAGSTSGGRSGDCGAGNGLPPPHPAGRVDSSF